MGILQDHSSGNSKKVPGGYLWRKDRIRVQGYTGINLAKSQCKAQWQKKEPLGLHVSWPLQSFCDSAEEVFEPACIAGENVEFRERFSYLGIDVASSSGSETEMNKRLALVMSVLASLDKGVWSCRFQDFRTWSKVQVFRTLVPVLFLSNPVLFYKCET